MSTLSRDQILGAIDTKIVELEVPEWGGTVRIRALTGGERDQLDSDLTAAKAKNIGVPNFRSRFAAMTICDEKGLRLFDDRDIPLLAKKSGDALDRILDAGAKLNRLGSDEVKHLAGESAGDRSSASGAGSPSLSA